VATPVLLERVRSDVDVLARAGLPLDDFLVEAAESLQRAVPWTAACIATIDPATRIVSSARKYGGLDGRHEHDIEWGHIEYAGEDTTAYRELHEAGEIAVGMHVVTGGDVERSPRMEQLISPRFGYADEARMLFADGGSLWGGIAIFRGGDDPSFSVEETDFLATLAPAFARGVRAGILAQIAGAGTSVNIGPAVAIMNARNEISQLSPGAEARIRQLGAHARTGDPPQTITSLAASARRYAAGDAKSVPRVRVRTFDGAWLLLHASPLASADGSSGDVVVTIEEARPPEIIDLVVSAYDLTPRERDVTRMVLQGLDTKEIAAALFLSPYTVQDHLKSIFEKAGVRSRRELIATIAFEQYVPRMDAQLGPTGTYASV